MLEKINKQDKSYTKAKAIFDVICDGNFWEDIQLFAHFLELFAVTAFTLQADITWLDYVFLYFEKLYSQFEFWHKNLQLDHESQSIVAVF